MAVAAQPRGLRNNNPLNIRHSTNKWQGLAESQTDSEFCQFRNVFWGIRAAFVIIKTYITKYKCNTPGTIISRWAPSNENDTEAYILAVTKKAVLDRGERLAFSDKNKLCRLLWGMAFVENGQEVPFNYFERAYAMV